MVRLGYCLRADPSHSVFGYISFKFEKLHEILTLWSFIVTFDIVTNKDFEIFTLSEMTEHGMFTIVPKGQKYLFRNNIFS